MELGSILENIKTAIEFTALGGAAYVFGLIGSAIAVQIPFRRINSQQQAEQLLKEKSSRLGLDASNISIFVSDRVEPHCTDYAGRKRIRLKQGCSSLLLNHELYHIAKEHTKHKSWLRYYGYEEPASNLYALTGIKI